MMISNHFIDQLLMLSFGLIALKLHLEDSVCLAVGGRTASFLSFFAQYIEYDAKKGHCSMITCEDMFDCVQDEVPQLSGFAP